MQRSVMDLVMSATVDKAAHFGVSYFLVTWFGLKRPEKIAKVLWLVFLLGVVKEAGDARGAYGADPLDLLSNAVGIALAWIVVLRHSKR